MNADNYNSSLQKKKIKARISNSHKNGMKNDKTCNEMKNMMKNRHKAVYHKSNFSLSSDLVVSNACDDAENHTMCRICQSFDDSVENQQVTPCGCSGSLRYVHMQCLKTWRQTKKAKGADVCICELCKQPYNTQLLGDTNVSADVITKLEEDLKKLVKSGIYLMLLVNSWKRDVANIDTNQTQRALSEQPSSHLSPVDAWRTPRFSSESSGEDNDNYVTREALKHHSEHTTLRKHRRKV